MTVETCSVCGRTILKGELTRVYLTADGESHNVCELCRGRAEASGWIWEAVAAEQPQSAEPERRIGISSRLRGRAREAGQSLRQRRRKSAEDQDAVEQRERQAARSEDPAAPGAGVRARPEAPPGSRRELALAEFNRSEHAHTVAGLIRTLGIPQVTVGNGAGEAGAIRITVAWELTWYQWTVKVSGESADVQPAGRGQEIAELDAPARHWNARASEDGSLSLGTSPARLESEPATQ